MFRGSDQTGRLHGQLCLHHGRDNKSESVRLLSFSLTNNTVEIKCLTLQMFKVKYSVLCCYSSVKH